MKQLEKLTLDNGLRVLLLPVEGALSASVGVWVEAGARYEPADKQGISHFVEHMAFKGTHTRTARQISEEMDLLGGGMNAYTTKEYTRFYAQTLAENARPAMELLADMLLHSRMAAEDVEVERGVILEEMAMYEDAGEDVAHEALCGAVWPRSPLGRPICGTRKTVESIQPGDLLRYVAEEYAPGRMVAVAAGGYNREEMLACIDSTLGGLKPGAPRPTADAPAFTPGVVLRKKKFEQVSLELAVPGLPFGEEEKSQRYALMLFNFIAGGGASSRLFLRLREELGLAYSIYSTHYASKGAGLFTVSAAGKSGRSWLGWPEESGRKNFCGPGPRSNPPLSWDWKAWPPGPPMWAATSCWRAGRWRKPRCWPLWTGWSRGISKGWPPDCCKTPPGRWLSRARWRIGRPISPIFGPDPLSAVYHRKTDKPAGNQR